MLAASFNQKLKFSADIYKAEEYLIGVSTISLVLAIFFYIMTLLDPGYVPKRDDFIPMLEKMLNDINETLKLLEEKNEYEELKS